MAPQPPVTILVIDDTSAFVSALTLLLRRDGYTVLTARNGNIALALLQERRYDVILCDVQMPGLEGPTFADILRSQYPHLRQRVIFLMADALNAESLVFLKQYGQPWLYKPCTIVAIRSAIAQVLRAVDGTTHGRENVFGCA